MTKQDEDRLSPILVDGAHICCPNDDFSCSALCSWTWSHSATVKDKQARGDYGGAGSRSIPGGCT